MIHPLSTSPLFLLFFLFDMSLPLSRAKDFKNTPRPRPLLSITLIFIPFVLLL